MFIIQYFNQFYPQFIRRIRSSIHAVIQGHLFHQNAFILNWESIETLQMFQTEGLFPSQLQYIYSVLCLCV